MIVFIQLPLIVLCLETIWHYKTIKIIFLGKIYFKDNGMYVLYYTYICVLDEEKVYITHTETNIYIYISKSLFLNLTIK